MPLTLQSSVNGVVRVYPLNSYARLGSSSDCDVVIAGAGLPAHALTIVEDGVHACRVIVKGAGLRINGADCPESAVIPFGVGTSIQLQDVTLSLVAGVPQAPSGAAVVTETVRDYLPEVSTVDEMPVAQPATSSNSSGSSIAVQIAGIVFCLLAVVGMVIWMLLGGPATRDPSEAASRVRMAAVISEVQNQEEWPWKKVRREEVVDLLRRANHLESHGDVEKARKVMILIRERLLDEIPTDATGHYILPEPDAAPTVQEGSQKPVQPTLAEVLFPDKERRQLYESVIRKLAELGEPGEPKG